MATIYELIPNFQQHLMTLGEFAQWFPQMEYHNYDNSMITAARAYLAANECQLPEEDQRNLTLAALYANTKYVGYFDDDKNIENSLTFWKESFAKVREHSEEDYCNPKLVKNLIRATRQGYHPDPREVNWLLKALLRDCITLQALSPEWRSYLEKEIYDTVTLEDIYNSLITDWAKDYYKENVDALNKNSHKESIESNKNEIIEDQGNNEALPEEENGEAPPQEIPESLPNIDE